MHFTCFNHLKTIDGLQLRYFTCYSFISCEHPKTTCVYIKILTSLLDTYVSHINISKWIYTLVHQIRWIMLIIRKHWHKFTGVLFYFDFVISIFHLFAYTSWQLHGMCLKLERSFKSKLTRVKMINLDSSSLRFLALCSVILNEFSVERGFL